MTIHPSLIEKVSLDAREFNADVAADVKRCLTYVGPVSVVSHEASDPAEPACNVMRMVVRMGRPYWGAGEGDADAMWGVMRTWLDSKQYKLGSAIANFNKTRGESGQQTVSYGRLDVDMKPYVFSLALPQGDELPGLSELVGRFRAQLNGGALAGLEIAGVDMPSAESLAAQVQAAKEAFEAEPTASQADESDESAAEGTEGASEAGNVEADAGEEKAGEAGAVADAVASDAAVADEGSALDEGVASSDGSEADGEVAVDSAAATCSAAAVSPTAPTSIDYAIWDVRLASGEVRQFDSVSGVWL